MERSDMVSAPYFWAMRAFFTSSSGSIFKDDVPILTLTFVERPLPMPTDTFRNYPYYFSNFPLFMITTLPLEIREIKVSISIFSFFATDSISFVAVPSLAYSSCVLFSY